MLLLPTFVRVPSVVAVAVGVAVAASAALLCAVPQSAVAQPKAAPGTPLAECAAANRQTLAELTQDLQASTRRHVASPMTISRLQGLDASLRKLRDGLGRSSRGLADCEQMALGLAGERERLLRITGVSAAAGSSDAGAVSVASVLAAAPTAPVQSAASAPVDGSAPAAMPATSAATSAATPTPSPSDPACREAAAHTYNELATVYAGLVQPARLQAAWLAPLKAVSERLTLLHASIAAAPAPGWDCAQVTQGLAQARAELGKLAP